MTVAAGVRIGWADVPAHVRAAVERILGGPVVSAVSQRGGFSPGTADRVVTASGRRAFVKAVGTSLNERSPVLHRQEALVTAALPESVPAPRLLGVHDDGDWVALVLTDVEGRHPDWNEDLDRVLEALRGFPPAFDGLPRTADALRDDFAGWQRVAADPPADLDPWVAERLDELVALADPEVLDGDALVHTDVRADNLLVGAGGRVTFVDWPWASRGVPWFDSLLVLLNARSHGLDTTQRLDGLADPTDIRRALAGLAGYFVDVCRQPPPAGLPTVRTFQRAQADLIVGWLRELS